jgi:hypothetical protein
MWHRVVTGAYNSISRERLIPPQLANTHRDQRTLTQRVDPVLVPQRLEQLGIETTLEHGDLERVVGVGVHTKVLDLVQRNGLVLGGCGIRRSVSLRGVRNQRANKVITVIAAQKLPLDRS